jgi:hypothetical protein
MSVPAASGRMTTAPPAEEIEVVATNLLEPDAPAGPGRP